VRCKAHQLFLVNHALTGNSNVTGSEGWWNALIGPNKPIDTNLFSVLAFNIPGNGFDGNPIISFVITKTLLQEILPSFFFWD
jgi:homoserine acetyltransferase